MRHSNILLAFVVMCIFKGFFAKDKEDDEIEMQERRLPQYLRDDGIRRVAKLNAKNFQKTLKQSRMLVVLFYVTNKENPEADKVWRTDEQMLEVGSVGVLSCCCQ